MRFIYNNYTAINGPLIIICVQSIIFTNSTFYILESGQYSIEYNRGYPITLMFCFVCLIHLSRSLRFQLEEIKAKDKNIRLVKKELLKKRDASAKKPNVSSMNDCHACLTD